MIVQPSEFYDQRLDGVLLNEAAYLPLYRTALNLVLPGSVVELGSGTGTFAKMLLTNPKVTSYLGIDFAPLTTAIAKQRVGEAYFKVDDLRTCPIPPADTYVTLETLEHLEDDIALLNRLPIGSTVVLSVPSFPSESHVRWFPSHGDAIDRYNDALTIDYVRYILVPNSVSYFHLIRGKKEQV